MNLNEFFASKSLDFLKSMYAEFVVRAYAYDAQRTGRGQKCSPAKLMYNHLRDDLGVVCGAKSTATDVRRLLVGKGVEVDKRDAVYVKASSTQKANPLSPEKLEVKCQRIRSSRQANPTSPEAAARGAKKISMRQRNYWDNLSDDVRETRRKNHSAGAFDRWDSTSIEERKKIGEAHSPKMKEFWKNLSDENREVLVKKISKNAGRMVTLPDGLELWIHSSWELSMYLFLSSLGKQFRYANQHGTTIRFEDHSWSPDFVLDIDKEIIEVKGDKRARPKFFERNLPAFRRSKYAREYRLWVYEDNVHENSKILTYEDLLRKSTLYSDPSEF